MKIGDLVVYVPEASAVFHWQKMGVNNYKTAPGIIIEQVEHSISFTRRFKVRWHSGVITEEWISYLVEYDDEKG
jgi:hypothetical protein